MELGNLYLSCSSSNSTEHVSSVCTCAKDSLICGQARNKSLCVVYLFCMPGSTVAVELIFYKANLDGAEVISHL